MGGCALECPWGAVSESDKYTDYLPALPDGKYFANDLRQVATAEIEQMIPIFRTIQLTPESMPVPDYPLPDE